MPIQAERIAQRRHKLGLSQEDLAAFAGTSQRQISKYETGKNDPTGDVLAALAQALDTTTDWLLGLTDNPERLLRGQDDLSDDERELLELYRRHSPDKRRQMRNVAKAL